MAPERQIRIKRAYDDAGAEDGTRVLVDRLWPRGLSKEVAALDAWDKDIAPSAELRRWYGHDPDLYEEFAARYRDELEPDAVGELRAKADGDTLTLLTATKDVEHSHAAVLADVLRERA